jgi:hypothetical protein
MSIKQHTRLWRSMKMHYLGANDCASILGHGFNTVDDVIRTKVTGLPLKVSADQQERMDYGTTYEPLVREECAKRNGFQIRETGMKFHSKHKFLTASPDGIYTDDEGQQVLTEFKVLGKLTDGKIPYKYWIQVQVQMEVWGVSKCLYCENLVKDGVVKDHYEILVNRDQAWFQTVLPVIISTWKQIEESRLASRRQSGASSRKRKRTEDSEETNVITGSMLVNYLRNDTLLDWLDKYGSKELKDMDPKFFRMHRKLSNEFTYRVCTYIKNVHGDLVWDIDEAPARDPAIEPDQFKVSPSAVLRTIKAMRAGRPIILNGCFTAQYQGCTLKDKADILIKNSYLQQVFGVGSSSDPNIYSIVKIQYAKLDLHRDGVTLANNNKQKAYSAKVWFISNLLSQIQGSEPNEGYIIGRSYKYGETKVTNAFGHIATVNLKDGACYEQALNWQIRLHTDTTVPQPAPNMKNNNDFPWHSYKQYVAQETNEITRMYRCGHRVKERAMDLGITRWSDLTPEAFCSSKGARVATAFLSAQAKSVDQARQDVVNKIRDNLPVNRIRFYLDFESTGSSYDDFSTFPEEGPYRNLIFLIGVIAEDRETGETEYFSYVADELNQLSELEILERMLQDTRNWMTTRDSGQQVVPFYYWSDAERQMLTKALGSERITAASLQLVDMCKIFRDEQIILPGQFGYGLKEIGGLMHRYGMIQTGWNNADISNGLDAMVEAIQAYKVKYNQDFFNDVIRYNYVDCKVMQEIASL